jgi:menaquinone-dependent protoporphyrinogen oxidase
VALKVLVAYATKHESTKGIATFIAERLREMGLEADALEVKSASNLGAYDAFVIGSAVYMFHWLNEAREFVSRNRKLLASRPVWLFSSGPLGTETKNTQGRDLRDVSGPREIGNLRQAINPRNHRVFFGALDRGKLGLGHRIMLKMPAAREALAEGDFRDWKEIEEWTIGIAQELKTAVAAVSILP